MTFESHRHVTVTSEPDSAGGPGHHCDGGGTGAGPARG